jgi:3-phytase
MRGRYSGKNLGAPEFRGQTTGLALYACSDSDGEWIGVDRDGGRSALLVFDRKSLSFLGAFGGKNLVDLGGITLQPASSTDFPEGVVYAISDRASIAAFDWRQVAQALSLNSDCR